MKMPNIFNKMFHFIKTSKDDIKTQYFVKDTKEFNIFANIPLFQGIPTPKLHLLYSHTKEINIEKNAYLFQEGDKANEFFIIVSGAVEVTKHDEKVTQEHQLNILKPGQTVGEMGLVDNEPRSASVKALEETKLLVINYNDLNELASKNTTFEKIYHQISKNISYRLRYANEITIRALERQIQEYKLRVAMGSFMVYVFSGLCIYTFSLASLSKVTQQVSSGSFVTIPLMLVLAIAIFLLIKNANLSLSAIGLTTKNWRFALKDAILYTIPLLLLILLYKWLELRFLPSFAHRSLFEPMAMVSTENASYLNPKGVWLVTLLFYGFFVSPLQELIVRGALQGSLLHFLTGKHKKPISVVVSNLIFSTVHIYLSYQLAIIAFLVGLFLGWLYLRHETLIGVTVSHFILGFWAMWIVGPF